MNIQPLGEQIIIKTFPLSQVGSIIIPDSAKGITMIGTKGEMEAVHFVEAEIVATGPGKRTKGDIKLVEELAGALIRLTRRGSTPTYTVEGIAELIERAENPQRRIPPIVKPGDRILYHPSVQRFDREITHLMNGDASGCRWFIIREESVLAVLE